MAIASKKAHRDLTEGNILQQIILFALPLIATSVLQLLFNTADTIVVGRWGGDTEAEREIALAAVGSCGAIINLVVNVFLGLSVGAGVCVAHAIGAKEFEDVEKTVHTAVYTALIGGVLTTAVGLALTPQLLGLIGVESSIFPEAILYMRAYFCGMPAALLYNYCAAMLRASGDTARPLGFLSIAGVANVLLNLVMVLVFKTGDQKKIHQFFREHESFGKLFENVEKAYAKIAEAFKKCSHELLHNQLGYHIETELCNMRMLAIHDLVDDQLLKLPEDPHKSTLGMYLTLI